MYTGFAAYWKIAHTRYGWFLHSQALKTISIRVLDRCHPFLSVTVIWHCHSSGQTLSPTLGWWGPLSTHTKYKAPLRPMNLSVQPAGLSEDCKQNTTWPAARQQFQQHKRILASGKQSSPVREHSLDTPGSWVPYSSLCSMFHWPWQLLCKSKRWLRVFASQTRVDKPHQTPWNACPWPL